MRPKDSGLVAVYEQGSAITVKRSIGRGRKSGPGGKRQPIKKFTRGSRRNLLRKVSALDQTIRPLFVTLTYPKGYSRNPEQWKSDLNSKLFKRMERIWPSVGYIWRLEFQKRGAPHFHLLLYNVDLENSSFGFREWLSQNWFEAVGSGDDKHLKAGTNAVKVRRVNQAVRYLAKEMAKYRQAEVPDDIESVGRYWGIKGKERLPWSKLVHWKISDETATRIMRLMARHADIKSGDFPSLTVFCNGKFWTDRMNRLIELYEENSESTPPERPLRELASAEGAIGKEGSS